MSGDARTPTWGYRPDGDAQIFDLAPGQSLPEGWHASPTCMTDPALATAEAVTARVAERSRLAAAATAPRPSAWSAGSTAVPIVPMAAAPAPPAALPPGFRRATPQEAEAFVQRLEDEAHVRRAAAVAKYGPEARATARCWREDALYDVATLLPVRGSAGQTPSLMGWTGGPRSSLPPEVRREIGGAVRMPATVAATWAEHRHWQERAEVRAAFDPDAAPPLWIRARVLLLEERLDTLPARDRDDVLARLDWMAAVLDLGYSRPIEEDEACLATLRQDIEGVAVPLRERAPDGDEEGTADAPPAQPQAPAAPPSAAAGGPRAPEAEPEPEPPSEEAPGGIDPGAAPAPVQVGQQPRTREEAREAVRALLAQDLTDREIARRVGVSPSTVAAVRRAPR